MNRLFAYTLRQAPRRKQRGVVLVFSLVVLLIMTIIGVTAMQSSILEEKMAGNLRDRTLAFGAAEAALRDAGALIDGWTQAPIADATGSNGVFANGTCGLSPEASDFAAGCASPGKIVYTGLSGVADDPVYAIEEAAFVPDDLSPESLAKRIGVYYYSVTALGFGSTVNSRAMVQAIVTRKFN